MIQKLSIQFRVLTQSFANFRLKDIDLSQTLILFDNCCLVHFRRIVHNSIFHSSFIIDLIRRCVSVKLFKWWTLRTFSRITVERNDSVKRRILLLLALCRVIIRVRSALCDSFADRRDLRVCLVCQFEHIAGVMRFYRCFHLFARAVFEHESSDALQIDNLILLVDILVVNCFWEHFNFVPIFKQFIGSLEVLNRDLRSTTQNFPQSNSSLNSNSLQNF